MSREKELNNYSSRSYLLAKIMFAELQKEQVFEGDWDNQKIEIRLGLLNASDRMLSKGVVYDSYKGKIISAGSYR